MLQQIGVDCIDESEVLTVADEGNHVNKNQFKVPFVCGCRNLGEALRRVAEGASMIRTKGEAGTGDVVEAVRHIRTLHKELLGFRTRFAAGLTCSPVAVFHNFHWFSLVFQWFSNGFGRFLEVVWCFLEGFPCVQRGVWPRIRMVQMMDEDELFTYAKEIGASIELLQQAGASRLGSRACFQGRNRP